MVLIGANANEGILFSKLRFFEHDTIARSVEIIVAGNSLGCLAVVFFDAVKNKIVGEGFVRGRTMIKLQLLVVRDRTDFGKKSRRLFHATVL